MYLNRKISIRRIVIFGIIIIFCGCLARPIVKKSNNEQHALQSKSIENAVLEIAKTGDWLVIRGYHAVDNLVSNATGIPISHVAVFDSQLQIVIEAEGKGIHESSLSEFVDKSYRLIIIRPRWLNENNAQLVISNAKKLVGKSYDFLGTIGFNYPKRYYCSELAVSIYKQWHRKYEKFPKVILPGELYLYGQILYDSRPRDEI